jgi:cobalamin biosynthesis protein CobT
MDQSIDRKDVVHKPSHLLIKTRDELLLKDFKTVKSRAQQRSASATKRWGKAPPLVALVNGVSANGKEDTSKISKGPANGINGAASPSLMKSTGANQTASPKEVNDEHSEEGSDDESDSGSVKEDSDGNSDSEGEDDDKKGEDDDQKDEDDEKKGEDDEKKGEDGDKATLQCLNCHERVTAPCWYCVDCISKLLQCICYG